MPPGPGALRSSTRLLVYLSTRLGLLLPLLLPETEAAEQPLLRLVGGVVAVVIGVRVRGGGLSGLPLLALALEVLAGLLDDLEPALQAPEDALVQDHLHEPLLLLGAALEV